MNSQTGMISGDESEFVKLLTDHQAVIRAFIISLLPGAPGVDDVIQETNVVLWKKREEFTMGTNFRAWALTVARFQTMVHMRELKKRHWVTLDEDVTELMANDIERIADATLEERRVAVLRNCIAKLRTVDQELLMERYWSKTRLLDFAVMTGRSMGGLKVRLVRLRRILKTCIESKLAIGGAQ